MSYLFWIADVFRKGPFPLPGRGSKVSNPYCISLHFQEQPKPLQKKTSKLKYVEMFASGEGEAKERGRKPPSPVPGPQPLPAFSPGSR
jgi:hypothetical protein